MKDRATPLGILGDAQFLLAISLGPLYWLVLIAVRGALPVDSARMLDAPFALLQTALLYPVLEEIVFRGAVQDFLRRRLRDRRWSMLSAANLATSVLFAATHVASRGDLATASVFLPSLVFGYFRERHATLASPIALHVFYNAGMFALLGAPFAQ